MSEQVLIKVFAFFGFVFGTTAVSFMFLVAHWIETLRRRIEALEPKR